MISQSIGWTLIHSVWQGLGVYILLKAGSRLTSKANVRYGMGVAALGILVACSIATFFILNVNPGSEGFSIIINAPSASTSSGSVIQTALSWIDNNIIWLLRFWTFGLVAGILRIAAGLWYINRLRRNANPVQAEWLELVKQLSSSLNITRAVTMAEAAITSPMVVGFMKPMILFPVGLLSGLTTEQVETILVHELSHVRRHDYIINLVQSLIETVFFFNPFALLMSALIREERENCCDDLVIAKGISPISYVKTLAQLEAGRLTAAAARSSTSLALGFTGNQNQLLNRIKRIMENSAKNDWGKGRLVPVALLFLGLICASWLSIGSEKKEQNDLLLSKKQITRITLASDTSKEGLKVIKKKNNTLVLEEPTEIPVPPVDDIWIEEPAEMPVPDSFEFNFENLAYAPMMFEMPNVPDLQYNIFDMDDSIPGYTFRMRSPADWEQFEAEFKEKFKSQFKDFYTKNQKQFDKMLAEMKKAELDRDHTREAAGIVDLERMAHQRESNDVMLELEIARHNQALAEQMMSLDVKKSDELAEVSKNLAELAERNEYNLRKRELDVLRDQYRESESMYSDMTRRYEDFKKALAEQLVADGYIKSGDEINQININDNNGEMTFNGKKIKEKDKIKYKALQDQYFKTKRAQIIPGRSE
ncbi:MAG: M56 family metallopeptidase [Bacteroidota bacterium]